MEPAKKLLLIEDDLYTRELYENILGDAGFEVATAEDGEDGLAKSEMGGFSIILLDLVMPKMDGIQFLSAYSNGSVKDKNGPVVVFTNLAHDPVIRQAIKLGAKGYIIKSDLTHEQLIKEVGSYI